MKTIFEFLYYCLYRMMALVKKERENEELASFFYPFLITTNFYCPLLLLKFFINLSQYNEWLVKGIVYLSFLISYLYCRYYFIKKKNYLRIINNYEEKYPDKKITMVIIGITYSLFTFLSFIILISFLSKIEP